MLIQFFPELFKSPISNSVKKIKPLDALKREWRKVLHGRLLTLLRDVIFKPRVFDVHITVKAVFPLITIEIGGSPVNSTIKLMRS